MHVVVSWLTAALSLLVAAAIVPGVSATGFWAALGVALVVAVLNAVLPPVLAALRLPFTLVLGFLVVLLADAAMLWLASDILESGFAVDSFWWALLAALVASAVSLALEVVFGANDDDTYTLRVTQTSQASSSSRSTGSPCPCFDARCGTAALPTWPAGCRRGATGSWSGRRISPRRQGRARRGSCSGRTRTFPLSAGWRRRRPG
jgi:putative membrane protein